MLYKYLNSRFYYDDLVSFLISSITFNNALSINSNRREQ